MAQREKPDIVLRMRSDRKPFPKEGIETAALSGDEAGRNPDPNQGVSLGDILTQQANQNAPFIPLSEEEFGSKEKHKPLIEVLEKQAREAESQPLPESSRIRHSEEEINKHEKIRQQYEKEIDYTTVGEKTLSDDSSYSPFSKYAKAYVDQDVVDGTRTESDHAFKDYWNEPEGEQRKWHYGMLRMAGEAWMGTLAGGFYTADALIQTFADAANLASDDPNQDIRVFSILGDLIMQDGGPAKDIGRDVARMSLLWFPLFKMVKKLGAGAQSGARFISGAKGMMESKKYRLGKFIGKDIPAGALAQFINGAVTWKAAERGPGGAIMQSLDKWFGENLGTPYIAEYFAEDDPSKSKQALSRLYNAFGEMFLQIGLDKLILPALKAAGVKIAESHKYIPDKIKERLVKMISLEKHMLAFDKRSMVNAQGKAGTYVIINDKGQITIVPRGDGTMEIVRSGKIVPQEGKIKIKPPKLSEAGEREGFKLVIPPNLAPDEGLKHIDELFKNGTLSQMLAQARTFDERMALLQDLASTLHTFSSAGKTSKTFQEMLKESDAIIDKLWGWDKAAMLSRKKGSPVNEAIGLAYARVAESSFNEMVLAIQNLGRISVKGGGQMASGKDAFNEFFRTLRNYAGIRQQYEDVFSVAGRTLGVKRWAKGHHDDIIESPEFAKIMAMEDKANMDDVMKLAAVLSEAYLKKGKQGLTKAVEEFGRSGYKDAFYQGYIGTGLLLTPALWMLNLATGLGNVTVQVGSRQFAGLASQIFGKGDVKLGAATAGVVGLLAGITTALKGATKALLTGKSFRAFQGSKMESWFTGQQALSSRTLGIENNVQGLGVDALGKGAFMGERVLFSGDTLVKIQSAYAEIYMSGYSKAMVLLKEGGHKWSEKGTYEKFTTLFQDIIENPRSYTIDGKTIFDKGVEAGKLNTFQKELGDLGKTMQRLQTQGILSPVLRLWVPFIKVLSNIPKFFVQNTPAGVLNIAGKNSIYKKGVPQARRMEEAGRMTLGAMLIAFGSSLYNSGNLRGHSEAGGVGEPADWRKKMQKRAVGRPDMAIKHMDDNGKEYWIDIKKFQPYSDMLAFGADFAKIAEHKDDAEAADILWQMVMSSKDALINTSWLPNLEKIMEIFSDRIEPHKYKQLLYSLQTPFQLAPFRNFRKADVTRGGNVPPEFLPYSLTLKDGPEDKLYDLSTLSARWKAGIKPHTVAPARDWRGRVVTTHNTEEAAKKGVTPFNLPPMLTTGMMSFMPVFIDKADKLDRAIEDLGVVFAKPTDVVYDPLSKRATKMLPWEYDYFRWAIGNVRDGHGDTLAQKLTKVMGLGKRKASKLYKTAPEKQAGDYPADKEDIVKAVYNNYVTLARNLMVNSTKEDGSPSDLRKRLNRMGGEVELQINTAAKGMIVRDEAGARYVAPENTQIEQFQTDYSSAEDRFPRVPRQSSRGVAGDNR